MKQTLALLIFVFLFSSGCYYDKYDKIYPPSTSATCDSTNVTYSVTVRGILDGYCMGCHGSTSSYPFDTYDGVNNYVSNGFLMGDVKQITGFPPMPPTGKLSDCDIAKLQKWVNDGAPNN